MTSKMWSQKMKQNFGNSICVDSTDSEKEDVHNSNILCHHHPSYLFNRDTCQMSPLLFESDTDDTSQSTEFKCYQEKLITPKPSDQHILDMLSTLTEIRNELSSHLDTPSQHNQRCSETLLNNTNHRTVHKTKLNTYNAYVSPSPRVTRSKLLNSRMLTRSAKRIHKINDFSDNTRNSKKLRTRKDLNKRRKSATNGKDSNLIEEASNTNEKTRIESLQKSNVKMKYPFFQNTIRIEEKFIQPNIVPNIELHDTDNELDFLDRRPSSEVQILTDRPAVISISSESPHDSARHLQCVSPDLFENCENVSVSHLCSQSSFDIPNGQVLLRSADDTTSNPNDEHNSTTPTPSATADRQKLFAELGDRLVDNTFEITSNDVFANVIHIEDSDKTLTPQTANRIDEQNKNLSTDLSNASHIDKLRSANQLDNLIDLTKSSFYQEVTPKRRPEMRALLNKSPRGCHLNTSFTLNRTKWLSKPRSSNSDGELTNRTTYRCRRLDLWFQDVVNKSMLEGNGGQKNVLLSSSEDEDS